MNDHIQYISKSFPDADTSGWTGPGWYFWDEIQANCHGPYQSRADAEKGLEAYAKEYLGEIW